MEERQLTRGLKARHIELIALGGTIGVGLFMGSASTNKAQRVFATYVFHGVQGGPGFCPGPLALPEPALQKMSVRIR
ncbi:Hypothetical protein DEACI_0162 [Acididesulfobacillus acetoxydans]|uniref:Amino acid permease/ SLC12A domain-containing protein n=1 Tax=Acididesulfobacillus acetoxydans TaxID=1561005 RepID=A0A8S0XA75_9FIRM|nr:Hypothetical protein DEACI_0162 [Acididesulfobacillus acetoxydans]CEJ07731.1 Hypothetical protein DEACI_2197 [Acididesulfobacillus acetoxydans]